MSEEQTSQPDINSTFDSTGKESSEKEKQSWLAPKDYITVGISSLALILTILSFYFTNVRVTEKLQARIVHYTHTYSDSWDTILLKIAFINSGNREVMVFAPLYNITDDSSKRKNSDYLYFEKPEIFPIILEPQQMKITNLRLPINKISSNTNATNEEKVFISISYNGLDAEGERRNALTDFIIKVLIREKHCTIGASFKKDTSQLPRTIIIN